MRYLIIFTSIWMTWTVSAQPRSPIMRYPDVSARHIVFSFANDLWLVDKSGGLATKLSSPPGQELWPRFSPDGNTIAFTGNYDGVSSIYTLPIEGGIPTQITFHSMDERVVDWFPDGNYLLYSSSKYSGKQRYNQFFKVSVSGGLSEKLPIEHAEMGSISPDGQRIAFTNKTRLFRTWKRYRGGTASEVYVFDMKTNTAENITNSDANDELPMWCGNRIYYLSDKGDEMRFNLWRYDLRDKTHKQVTFFNDYDVHFPAAGPDEIVFEAGGELYLMALANESLRKVEVRIVADFDELKTRHVKVTDYMQGAGVSPDGNRIVVEARGEIFSLPAEKGVTLNLSNTASSAERYPSWAPDGKAIAYWSDNSGEYELYLHNPEDGSTQQLTKLGPGHRYRPHWSPDSKKIAFVDQALNVYVLDIASKKHEIIAKQQQLNHWGLVNFSFSWSSDSRWVAFNQQMDNGLTSISIYDTEQKKVNNIDGGFYNLYRPEFDPEGRYLYVAVANHFSPTYSGYDNSFIYTNNLQLGAFTLTRKQASLLEPENDEVTVKKEESNGEKKDEKDKKEEKKTIIDFDDIGSRLVILPEAPGNYRKMAATTDKLIFLKGPNNGESNGKTTLKYFDLKKRESKDIISDITDMELSSDGKKLLVSKGRQMAVIDVAENQKMDKTIDLNGMRMRLEPRLEWQQLFDDAWRIQRDYFYDKNMHGVDWIATKQQYQMLLDKACSRSDVNYVIGEMIAELNASHAYRGGGDSFESTRSADVGYLGIDWGMQQGQYTVNKIVKAAPWDTEVRSPLAEPGIDVPEGSFILSVNGMDLGDFSNPYAAFMGLAGKTVELLINDKPQKEGARKVLVKTLQSETRLRNLAWIESNRQYVDEASGGRIGYIYVPSTGWDGQMELVRMFYGQFKKDALIIDERFNNGGQIPDRFIELLDRKPLAFWKTRDGRDWQWPPVAHFGPKAMLINGWSGSGGDAFPDYFRKAGLGPLIGTRTWGGLIGISGAPPLIDGGNVTAPTFRMFHPDGTWFPEGYGVDPDIEVPEDYTAFANGEDAQLKKAVEVLMQELKERPFVKPDAPPVEKRTR
jgi:tricorn protease